MSKNDEDRLRCLPKNANSIDEWKNCPVNVAEEIEEKIDEEKINLDLNVEGQGYYGIIDKKTKKFKIRVPDDPSLGDKRKLHGKGATCISIVPVDRITDIIVKLGIKPRINVTMKKRSDFIDSILNKTGKFKKKDLKDENLYSDDEIKSLYFWFVKAKKKDMCDTIEKWFDERGLILPHEL